MGDMLELVVCSNYRAEVEAVIRTEGWQDVRVETFQRMCVHPRQELPPIQADLQALLGKADVAVINCQRMQPGLAADNFYQLPQCFFMLANRTLVQDALRRGFYVLAPGWLAHWREHLAEWGLDQETARQFFKESMTGLLLLDTGLDEYGASRLEELGAYLDMSTHTEHVGLDFLRLYLTNIVSAWRFQNVIKKIEGLNREANRIAADYAMVIDLLTRLTQTYSVEEVHSEISDLFTMLFSSGDVVYYPVEDGKVLQTHAHSLEESRQQGLQDWLKNSTEPFLYTPSGRGFCLRIEHQSLTLGVIVADNLTLPQHMNQYLNLALMIARLCGLSIANANNYQKLQQAEAAAHKARKIAETLRITMSDLSSRLGREDLLERILVSLNHLIPYWRAMVYLKSDAVLEYKSGLRVKPSNSFAEYQPSEKYRKIDASWWNGDVMMLEDVERIPQLQPYVNTQVVGSWIALPLRQGRAITGLLSIASQEKGVYNAETVALAQVFASEVSIVLENERLFTELTRAAISDSLTGLYNRRHFYELAVIEFARSRRYRRPLSGMMMDIDHFKKVNDTYGHLAGDQVLIRFAELCTQNKRGADILGRYGGEEFVMLLPETSLENATVFAERLRKLIADTPVPTSKGPLQITCSLGIATVSGETRNLEELLDRCDQALYRAKADGRNRVCCL